jgi:hypothetical protein
MSDRFPYNMPSRKALVELVRRSENRPGLRDEFVTFEDLFFSPTDVEPGRTYIEMVDKLASLKYWYEFRRLELSDPRCLGPVVNIRLQGDATPANIALEINRARKMHFEPSDVSFSDEPIPYVGNTFEYEMRALSGSYVYYGKTKVIVDVVPTSRWTRYEENAITRRTETGITRELEHRITQWG